MTGGASAKLFHALVVAGLLASVALAVIEAGDEPAVEVVRTGDERADGDAWVLEADVRNNSGEARCPEIRIAARDTEARDVAEAVAVPVAEGPALAPGATVRYRARLVGISEEEYDEEVEQFSAYVYDDRTCPAE